MDRQTKRNVYDLLPESREQTTFLKAIFKYLIDITNSLKLVVDEKKKNAELQHSIHDSLKIRIENLDKKMESEILELTTKQKDLQSILIGSELGSSGGIKKDINRILDKLNKKTPVYLILGGVSAVLTAILSMLAITYKLIEISKLLGGQ